MRDVLIPVENNREQSEFSVSRIISCEGTEACCCGQYISLQDWVQIQWEVLLLEIFRKCVLMRNCCNGHKYHHEHSGFGEKS